VFMNTTFCKQLYRMFLSQLSSDVDFKCDPLWGLRLTVVLGAI